MGLVAPRNVESSWIRDRTHVPCIGKWILTTVPSGKCLLLAYFLIFINPGAAIDMSPFTFLYCLFVVSFLWFILSETNQSN